MNDIEITQKLRKLFDGCETPGQAFDLFLEIRRAEVHYEAVVQAILRTRGVVGHPQDETEPSEQPVFQDQKLTFGKYIGKTLTEIGKINPGYLKWLSESHADPKLRKQAGLAIVLLSAQAPHYADTDSTGYFDQ